MLNRLANVIYWLGCGFAVLFAIAAVANLVRATSGDSVSTILCGLLAAVSFGVGRGARYILAGK
jgi:uncharacterized membrane protein